MKRAKNAPAAAKGLLTALVCILYHSTTTRHDTTRHDTKAQVNRYASKSAEDISGTKRARNAPIQWLDNGRACDFVGF